MPYHNILQFIAQDTWRIMFPVHCGVSDSCTVWTVHICYSFHIACVNCGKKKTSILCVWIVLEVTYPHYWTVHSSLRRGHCSKFGLKSSCHSQNLTLCTSNLTQGQVLLFAYLVASAELLEVSNQTWKLACHPWTWPPAVELWKCSESQQFCKHSP